MVHLGGMFRSLTLQLYTRAAPVLRQSSCAATTWRLHMVHAPPVSTLPGLHRQAPPACCGLHTSSSLHKHRRDAEEDEFQQMLRSHRQELRKTPRAAVYLSLASLLPVVGAPLTMSLGGYYYPEMAFLQLAAASCLLSFYGGIRWGISVPENSPLRPDALNLGLGALLPFFAWTSLVVSDDMSVAALMLIGGMLLGVFGGVGLLPRFRFG
ncbi:Transmembrane protein 69 [Pristimantis euphronides]